MDREYKFELRVNGAHLMRGDAYSIGIVFGNFEGRNFTARMGHDQTHEQWLAYMAAEFDLALAPGMQIQMLNPDAKMLQQSAIGNGL